LIISTGVSDSSVKQLNMPKIQRLTLFKIPDAADIDKAIEAYGKVETDNQKVRSRAILASQ
jgi:hypothetical protein